MKNNSKNYLFLGLPKSGKTTYFSLMAYHLQQLANKSDQLHFLYLPTKSVDESTGVETESDITSDFIGDCIDRLTHQKWPKKTQDYSCGYSFEFHKLPKWFKSYGGNNAVIDYHDYPGEAFEEAFGEPENATEEMKKYAENMKDRIRTAEGIILILDANELFNGTENSKYGRNIVRLFRYIRETNEEVKVSVVFNKLELFFDEEIDFRTQLRKKNGNAYSYLRLLNYRIFDVYPLGTVTTGDDGKIYPPTKIVPRNILEPIRWMIGF